MQIKVQTLLSMTERFGLISQAYNRNSSPSLLSDRSPVEAGGQFPVLPPT
ncbi:hypothetical protein CCP3SC15_140012 [Gammaproteobacteria bacterium]